MTAGQLGDWREYYAAEPWGDNLLDQRLAGIQCTYSNVHRDTVNHPEPFKVHQFAAYLEQPAAVEDDPEIISAQLECMFNSFGQNQKCGGE